MFCVCFFDDLLFFLLVYSFGFWCSLLFCFLRSVVLSLIGWFALFCLFALFCFVSLLLFGSFGFLTFIVFCSIPFFFCYVHVFSLF